jgi:hypothetical protein
MKHKQTACPHICYYFYFNSINSLINRKFLFLLFIYSILILCANSYNQKSFNCNKNYLEYDENHTACKTPKDNCPVIKVKVFVLFLF